MQTEILINNQMFQLIEIGSFVSKETYQLEKSNEN